MSAIPIPENAAGRVGLVASLNRVNERDIGKLVVVKEPAGFVTSLVGSTKPVFAWLVQVLGKPIDVYGKESRNIYVADPCLVPFGEIPEDEIEKISRAQVQEDIDAALQELKVLFKWDDVTNNELEQLLNQTGEQFFLERALEVVPVSTALREIGFRSSFDQFSNDALAWTGIHNGIEIRFMAGQDWSFQWKIVGTCNTGRQMVWDERLLPGEMQRGKVVSTILSVWRDAFRDAPIPDCLQLGELFDKHQEDMRSLTIGVPSLSVEPRVFRAILRWLRPKYDYASPGGFVTLSYNDGLLRIDAERASFGCPAVGRWVDACKVYVADLIGLYEKFYRSERIELAQSANHILVNGQRLRIQGAND